MPHAEKERVKAAGAKWGTRSAARSRNTVRYLYKVTVPGGGPPMIDHVLQAEAPPRGAHILADTLYQAARGLRVWRGEGEHRLPRELGGAHADVAACAIHHLQLRQQRHRQLHYYSESSNKFLLQS